MNAPRRSKIADICGILCAGALHTPVFWRQERRALQEPGCRVQGPNQAHFYRPEPTRKGEKR